MKHYWNLLMGKIKVKKRASFLSFKNIRAVLQAKRREIAGDALDTHIYEQILWRRVQVMKKSPECWEQGYCKVCGCEILGKTMEDRSCENEDPCYPDMMKDQAWEDYKFNNKIKFFE